MIWVPAFAGMSGSVGEMLAEIVQVRLGYRLSAHIFSQPHNPLTPVNTGAQMAERCALKSRSHPSPG